MVIYIEVHIWSTEFPPGGKWTPHPGQVDYYMYIILAASPREWVFWDPVADLGNTLEKMLPKLHFEPGVCYGPD